MRRLTEHAHTDAISAGILVIIVVVTIGGTAAGSGIASGNGLQLTLDAPTEATAGNETTIATSITTPELALSPSGNLTVRLFVNGTGVSSKTVTVSDGETVELNLTHTFEQPGEADVRVEASVELGGQNFSASETTTIDVSAPSAEILGNLTTSITPPSSPTVGENATTTVETDVPNFTGASNGTLTVRLLVDGSEVASKTVTVTANSTTVTNFEPLFDSAGETTITVEATLVVGNATVTANASTTVNVSRVSGGSVTVEGAAFPVPESLEDEVEQLRNEVSRESGVTLGINAFVLANRTELYVVFLDREPTKGYATVEGLTLESNVSTSNLTFGAIAANTTSFDTTGDRASVREVATNASSYALELVRVQGHYRRVATLYDPDEGRNVTVSATAGLVVNASVDDALFADPGGKAARLGSETVRNRSRGSTVVGDFLTEPAEPHLHTASLETAFWLYHDATVDGIVLPAGSAAREFVATFDRTNTTTPAHDASLLYLVDEQFENQSVADVSDVYANRTRLDGEILTIEARLNGTTISAQETIEHNTGCETTEVDVDGCANVVLDELAWAGVAWNRVPRSTDDALPVFGLSSHHQDSPDEPLRGRYRLTGTVVDGSVLNRSVTGPVLLVSDLERIGDVNRTAVGSAAQQVIADKLRQLVDTFYSGIDRDRDFKILVTNRTGAAFPVPRSLEDEVARYRQSVNSDLSPHAFVLATERKIYLVFTTQDPEKGLATVDGLVVEDTIPAGNLTIGGSSSSNLTVGVIGSVDTAVDTTGQTVTIPDLTENPDQYRVDLVRVSAPYRRISTLTDPDAGAGFTFVETAGVLVNETVTRPRLFDRPGETASDFAFNSSGSQLGGNASREAKKLLGAQLPAHVGTVSFENQFWASANATVDAIALSPGSAAREYVRTIERVPITVSEDGETLLYVVETDFQPMPVANVSAIAQRSDELDGEVVEVEARLYQERISVQELAEESTGCNEDLLKIQTSQGSVCVNVVQDNLLHGGVAWNSIPTARSDVLFVTGISATHQDTPTSLETGRYRIVGEVVSASRIDESLPDTSLLVVYELARLGDINYSAVAEEAKGIIENRTRELVDRLRSQIGTGGSSPIAEAGPPQTVKQGTTVTLDGRNSTDPDGDSLSYQWAQLSGPTVTLSDADTATPSFTAPNVSSQTTLTFELTVSDGSDGFDTDTVTITVEPKSDDPFEGVVSQYNTDGDSTISIAELGQAASDFARGQIGIAGLGQIAAAFAQS